MLPESPGLAGLAAQLPFVIKVGFAVGFPNVIKFAEISLQTSNAHSSQLRTFAQHDSNFVSSLIPISEALSEDTSRAIIDILGKVSGVISSIIE